MNFKKVLSTVAVASMLVACGGGTDGGSAGNDLKEGDTIKIGYIGPLTGETSSYGIPVANSIELAIEEYNASADAKFKVEFIKEDSQGKETDAVNAYNKLVGEGIVGLVGPVLTGESLAVGNASEKNMTPIVSSSASGDAVTLKSDGKTAKDNFFRTCSNDSKGGQFIASKVGDGTIKVNKVAVLTNSDSDFSIGCTESFIAQAKKDGTEIVLQEKYPATAADFATYIDKVKNSGADAVFIPDYYETIAKMVKQFKQNGFKGTFLGTDGWDGVLSVKNVDKSIFNGAFYTNTFDDRVDAVVNYTKAYKEKFGGETNMFGTMAYDATFVLIKAVEKANSSDPAAICKALGETNYTGITGTFQYDEQHNPTKDLVIKTIKDGAYSYLD
ncbi:MAG: ABC transporter substrate-binding protein [Coprobacillus sp.]|nr:ABC transporter substrate-binding protein [Coprobacillus sp.]MCI9093927.1 ABC transporter substrate-binding protein [Coprobacillus sp.]